MSLFDLNDDSFSSETSSSSIHSENHISGDASFKKIPEPILLPPVPPLHRANAPSASNSDVKRGSFTLTECEIRSAQQDRKRLLERKLASRMGFRAGLNPTPHGTNDHIGSDSLTSSAKTGRSDSSVFGNSIAAALQLRKDEQEELFLRKLRVERLNDPDLIEKDLEVGVFMTSAYKQMLRRHQKRHSGQDDSPGTTSDKLTDSVMRVQSNDDDDPLGVYNSRLVRNRESGCIVSKPDPPGPLSTNLISYASESKISELGNHYDQVMLMRLHEDVEAPGRKQVQEHDHCIEEEVSRPSLGELKTLVLTEGADRHVSGGIVEDKKEMLLPDAVNISAPVYGRNTDHPPDARGGVASQNEALIEHKHSLFLAREARKRHRVDAAFIDGCARRFEERMIKALHIG